VLERHAAAAEDERFLRDLYATTRPDLVSWDEAERDTLVEIQVRAQRTEWLARFPDSVEEVILLDGARIGRIWVAWLPDECRLVDMTLVPEHRRSGIGTRIVGEVLAEADRRRVPARLTVERTNGPSLAFSARLGFAVVAEDPVYLVLERPVSGAPPPRARG